MKYPSITEMPEADLVKLIYSDISLRDWIGVPPGIEGDVHVLCEVTPVRLGLASGAFGDVDALIVANDDFANSHAIQFKRVKITEASFFTRLPTKLGALKKAVLQANEMVAVPFAHVWLVPITVVDSRAASTATGTWANAPYDVSTRIRQALPLSALETSVGVYLSEIVQPLDRPVTETAMSGGYLIRKTSRHTQSRELTTGIQHLFSNGV